jgi:hypothetical protein
MSHKTAKRTRQNLTRLHSIVDRQFPGDQMNGVKDSMFQAFSRNLSKMSAADQIEALDKLEEISRKSLDNGTESSTMTAN